MDTGAIERLGELMAESHAQEASITKQPAERTPVAEQGRDQVAEITTEPALDHGVGAVAPTGPDPSPEKGHKQDHEQLHAAERDERDRERDDLTREPQPEEREIGQERDNDHDLGFGIE